MQQPNSEAALTEGRGSRTSESGTGLFGDLPHYAPRPSGDWSLYYLMMDEMGAAELTRPVLKGGTFVAAIERLYLFEGDEGEGGKVARDAPDDIADGFDPQVARKK